MSIAFDHKQFISIKMSQQRQQLKTVILLKQFYNQFDNCQILNGQIMPVG